VEGAVPKDYLVAKLEEAERLGIEARKTGKYWARIGWYVDKPGGEREAVIDIFDPRRGHDLVSFPEQQARGVVKIINDSHQHLDIILGAYIANDPKRAMAYVGKLFRTIKEAREVGRPRKDEEDKRPAQVVRYEAAHGINATLEHFGITQETFNRYERKVRNSKVDKN
jgi:hypothetical protein